MTDLEQRVAAALRECGHDDIAAMTVEGDAQPAVWVCRKCRLRFYPACPACVDVGHRNIDHPLAITEAPDAEPGLHRDGLRCAGPTCGHVEHTTSVDRALEGVVLRAAPPSSVDGEGLRTAASEVIAERNREGYFAARAVEFWHAVDRLESALAASGSASGAAEEGR